MTKQYAAFRRLLRKIHREVAPILEAKIVAERVGASYHGFTENRGDQIAPTDYPVAVIQPAEVVPMSLDLVNGYIRYTEPEIPQMVGTCHR